MALSAVIWKPFVPSRQLTTSFSLSVMLLTFSSTSTVQPVVAASCVKGLKSM